MNSLEQLREACAKVCDKARYENMLQPTDNVFEKAVMAGAILQCKKLAAAIRTIDLTQFERCDQQEAK